jgi:hypothetical protein
VLCEGGAVAITEGLQKTGGASMSVKMKVTVSVGNLDMRSSHPEEWSSNRRAPQDRIWLGVACSSGCTAL